MCITMCIITRYIKFCTTFINPIQFYFFWPLFYVHNKIINGSILLTNQIAAISID